MSLRDAEEADCRGELPEKNKQNLPPDVNITDDWTILSVETLERYAFLAYMDGKGFRYYIPAFMLSILKEYNGEMRCICTLSSLYPKQQEDLWAHHMNRYSLLNDRQRHTVAFFLKYLPESIKLSADDQKICERALRNYWKKYLPEAYFCQKV